MSKKELKIMQDGLKRQQSDVTRSKAAAKKLLLKLNLITAKGNLSRAFKPVK